MTAEEVPLRGGDMHIGKNVVVRVGDTVRRPVGPYTSAVHALLRHFEEVGLERVPRVLGLDDRGREILTYVPGEPALAPAPAGDGLVFDIGAFLREMHDCQATFEPGLDTPWQRMVGAPRAGEVVCHNDLFWGNVVVTGDELAGVIDWDLAAPAPRLHDVASAAMFWVPLRPDDQAQAWGLPTDSRRERLVALCDGYRLAGSDRAGLHDAVLEKAALAIATAHRWGRDERWPGWAEMWDRDGDRYLVARDDWLEEHGGELRSWLA